MTYLIRRRGAKSKLLPKIKTYFPNQFNMFIDMFFGGGSVSYYIMNNYKCKVIANDNDSNISNLFLQLLNNKDELLDAIETTPYHQDIFNYYKSIDIDTISDLQKAVRYLYLINYSYLGQEGTMIFSVDNSKKVCLQKLQEFYKYIQDIQFTNVDFTNVLKMIAFKETTPFIYADPPYLNTSDGNYESKSWSEHDAKTLVLMLVKSGYNFMISEFDNEFYKEMAFENKLNYITIGERVNLKNIRTEIIITNYKNNLSLF